MLASLRFQITIALLLLVLALVFALGVYDSNSFWSVFIVIAIAAIAAAAFGFMVTISIVRPLSRLTTAMRNVAAGDLAERLAPLPVGEVTESASTFNRMAQSIQDLVAAASQERNRLVAAINSSTDAVLAVDSESHITFANVAAERLFVRTQNGLVGQPFVWIIPNDEVLQALKLSRDDGRRTTLIIEHHSQQSLQVIATPIVAGGDWVALVVFHDLTEIRRTEQIRRDFVANVSHELRTPLASIKSVIETLQEGALEEKEIARDFLRRAEGEVDRLVQLVEELLELSRIESGEVPLVKKPVNIEAVITAAVDRLKPQAERQAIDLSVDLASNLPPITGDAERLERVVINLVHNALKFTPTGGAIRIKAFAAGNSLTVSVEDTGAGIDPSDLPRIFERFYKADRSRGGGGTGLGLAVVKHTIEAHGGEIGVQSQLGAGSTFTFSIPISA